MKKTLLAILALLLIAATAIGFSACNKTTEDIATTTPTTVDTTEAESTTEVTEPSLEQSTEEATLTEEVTSEVPANATEATTGATEATKATETTKAPETTTAPPADPFAPPENLGSLSKADLLAYFNKAANRVRKEKPGFKKDAKLKIDKISLSGFAAIANPIIEPVKNKLMPGDWEYETIAKGSSNSGKFLSENANASDLKASDLTTISATKNGANWVISLKVITENNPTKGTTSANSRVNCIATPEEVLRDITDLSDAISADVNKATLTYHDGYATITVNPKGQVIESESGFFVNALANDVKIGPIKTNVTAPQSTVIKCHDFIW
ncbi:MAG: hypothetical protein LBG83_07615 [Oscillospiraceae bacterium]|jgi:hypothetical protein|nr:hypothetical protein [Oscillospiraceae bacterium]